MKMRFYLIVLFSIVCLQLASCHDSPPPRTAGGRSGNYDSVILSVAKRCENCEVWDALFSIKEFVEVYEHSDSFIPAAAAFLSNTQYTDRQKKIAICSMQRARLDNYLKLVRHCKTLFDARQIPEQTLRWVIHPNFSNRYEIVRNYTDKDVRLVLASIQKDQGVSSALKELVESILSGQLWRNVKDAHLAEGT